MLYKNLIKPIFDFVFAFIAILITIPVVAVIFLTMFCINHKPIIFIQKRPGLNKKIFKLYKFATMNNNCSSTGELLPDELRLTKFGSFLRKTSLDELPQFYNVLKGEMSFVGPRPLLVEYLGLYNEEQSSRHNVKPGITGLAQVNGRNNISWKDKLNYDIVYVNKISFILDLKIIWATLSKLVYTKDVAKNGFVTTDKFEGNE